MSGSHASCTTDAPCRLELADGTRMRCTLGPEVIYHTNGEHTCLSGKRCPYRTPEDGAQCRDLSGNHFTLGELGSMEPCRFGRQVEIVARKRIRQILGETYLAVYPRAICHDGSCICEGRLSTVSG